MSRALNRRRSRGPVWMFSIASAQAHLLPDVGHGRLGHRADALSAGGDDLVDPGWIGHQLRVSLTRSSVVGHDPVGEDLLHVDTAGPGGALAVPQVLVVGAEETLELADVADLRA